MLKHAKALSATITNSNAMCLHSNDNSNGGINIVDVDNANTFRFVYLNILFPFDNYYLLLLVYVSTLKITLGSILGFAVTVTVFTLANLINHKMAKMVYMVYRHCYCYYHHLIIILS